MAWTRARAWVLDGNGRALPLSRRRDHRRRGCGGERRRLPSARAGAGDERLLASLDAPAPRDAERADGVPDRRGARMGQGERRLGALPQLLDVRQRAAPRGWAAALAAPSRGPLLPDRAAAQLQPQVLPGLASALPVLRALPRPAA